MMVLQPLAYQSVAMLKLIIIHVPYSTNIAGRNPWQNAAHLPYNTIQFIILVKTLVQYFGGS